MYYRILRTHGRHPRAPASWAALSAVEGVKTGSKPAAPGERPQPAPSWSGVRGCPEQRRRGAVLGGAPPPAVATAGRARNVFERHFRVRHFSSLPDRKRTAVAMASRGQVRVVRMRGREAAGRGRQGLPMAANGRRATSQLPPSPEEGAGHLSEWPRPGRVS